MSSGRPPPGSVRGLLRLAGVTPGGDATDRDLIRAFALDRSEAAFAALMARHGPMVRAVCRRALRDHHLADDAVQATFVVLARRAGAVRWKESLAGWLFEVARRVSRKSAAQAARRTARECGAAEAPEPAAPVPPPAADLSALQAALDDELARLPDRLRLPVVLCHLEGLSQEAVAKQLGVTDGQLRGRLYRAKLKLQDRLTRRGFTLTAVLLALAVHPPASALPPVLAAGTLRLATTPDAAVPAAVLALTHGVTPAMFTAKTVVTLAVFGVLGLGAGGWAVRSAVADAPPAVVDAPLDRPVLPPAPKPARPVPVAKRDDKPADPKDKVETVRGEIKAVDPSALKAKAPGDNVKDVAGLGTRLEARGSIRVKPDDGDQPELTVPLPADAPLTFHGKPVKPADLKPGMRVELDYKGNSTDLVALRAEWRPRQVVVKAVSPADRTFGIETGGDEGGFEVVLAVAADAAVVVDGLPAGLPDVPAGRKVEVSPSLDRKAVVAVRSGGDPADLPALVLKYDPAARLLTVSFEAEQGDVRRPVTLALPVAPDAKARLAGKDLPLAEVKPRMPARLRLSADRTTVVGLLLAAPLPEPKDDDKED